MVCVDNDSCDREKIATSHDRILLVWYPPRFFEIPMIDHRKIDQTCFLDIFGKASIPFNFFHEWGQNVNKISYPQTLFVVCQTIFFVQVCEKFMKTQTIYFSIIYTYL